MVRVMDVGFLGQTFVSLLAGVPLTLELAASGIAAGGLLALLLALARLSGFWPAAAAAHAYVFVFRGTPLLVQIFLIYYGLGQIHAIRTSALWPFLRQPYWCAVLALSLNTAAYASEVLRGGLLSVPYGQVEAARAYGMGRLAVLRRVTLPLAIRQALPAYGNEVVSMVKATSLASIITLMEVTGIAARLIAETYRAFEVFACAGLIYLAINVALTRLVAWAERRLSPQLRPVTSPAMAGAAR